MKPTCPPLPGLPRTLLALPLAILLLAIAPPSALAHAKSHHSSCSHPATAHAATSAEHAAAKHSTRPPACSQQKGRTKKDTAGPAKRRKRGHAVARGSKPAASPTVHATPASCEDGAAPVRASDGSFSCADESEPSCEDGATPTRSANGSELLCPVAQDNGEDFCSDGSSGECTVSWANSGEPTCEDGTAPVRMDSGSFACDDGSEPACEAGPAPAPSPDGSELLCEDVARES